MATATLTDNLSNKVQKIFPIDYSVVEIKDQTREVRIDAVLPFRVRFTAIQIEKLGIGNTPAIPLQVIGYSNYIL
jgi:hypothetical protein